MIELASGKIGHPWHGLYRGGVLELPNATTRPMPGTEPLGGDCYKLAIPGQAAVETTLEEAAAGMTWLNHAVISGRQHCLYGKPLSAMSWIYIDPDNKPWLATLAVVPGTLTITFKRFGVFKGTPATHTATASITVPADSVVTIDDFDSAGRQVALVARQEFSNTYGSWDWFVPRQVWLLTIAGPVTAPTLTLAVKDSGVETNESVISNSIPIHWLRDNNTLVVTGPFDGFPGSIPEGFAAAVSTKSGTNTFHSERAVGATLHGDVFALVKSVTHRVTVVTMTHDMGSLFNAADTDLQPTGTRLVWLVRATNVSESSGYYGLSINGNLTQFAVGQKVSNVEPFGPATLVSPLTIAGVTVSTDITDTYDGFSWPFLGSRRIHETRLGNRVYACQAFATSGQHLFIGVAGPVSNFTGPFLTNNTAPYFATVHHTTGELVASNSGEVCFV